VAASADALKRGAELFSRHCTSCHGSLGKGDGPVASYWAELPKDLSDPLRQDRLSDGEIFRQISTGHIVEGKEIMPAFAARLSEQDRWKIVLFVRTLRAAAQ
jgi:mono/diheme cytochrome c family protein